jgi:hypothetical protein
VLAAAGVLSNEDLQENPEKVKDLIDKTIQDIDDAKRAIHMNIFSSVGRFVVYDDFPGKKVDENAFQEPEMLRFKKNGNYESHEEVAGRYLLDVMRYAKEDVNLIQDTNLLQKLKENAAKSTRQFLYSVRIMNEITSRLQTARARVHVVEKFSEEFWKGKDRFAVKSYTELLAKTVNYFEVSSWYTTTLKDQFVAKPGSLLREEAATLKLMEERTYWHKRALKEREDGWRRLVKNLESSDDLALADF